MIQIADWLTSVVAALFAALLTAIGFLIRKILTNDKRISLLEAEIKQRNEYRIARDDQIDDQLLEIRIDIKQLIGKMNTDIKEDK